MLTEPFFLSFSNFKHLSLTSSPCGIFVPLVSALVLDIGSHTTRAGYAGEDVPKCVIPTAHGYLDLAAPAAEGQESSVEGGKVRKYFVGEEGANSWREGMEVGSMMRDGLGQYMTSLLA
jgi:actin-related protein